MNSLISKTKKQPIFYALVGLALFIAVFEANYYFLYFHSSQENSGKFQQFILEHLVFWKLYTLVCFVTGLGSYFNTVQLKTSPETFIFQILSIILVSLFSFLNSLIAGFIPIVLIFVLLIQFKSISSVQILTLISLSIGFALLISILSGIPEFKLPALYYFNTNPFPANIKEFVYLFKNPQNIITWLYGFSVLFFGYWVGKSQWLVNYHFYYNELKRLFKISFGLFILWLVLNAFDAYSIIIHWRVGQVFYLLDAFAANIIVLYLFVFFLIYLENYRWGKYLLYYLELAGRFWISNTMLLILSCWLIQKSWIRIPSFFYSCLWMLLIALIILISIFSSKIYHWFHKESF